MPRVTHFALNTERGSETPWFFTLTQVERNTPSICYHSILPSCTRIVQDSVRLTCPYRDQGSPEIAAPQITGASLFIGNPAGHNKRE